MQFNTIIGNPPYQEPTNESSDRQIYPLFMDEAYGIADAVIYITPAKFLFNAGKTSSKWNKKMLNDNHLRVLAYYEDGSRVFPNTSISGGLAVTIRNRLKKAAPISLFIPNPIIEGLIHRLEQAEYSSIKEIMYTPRQFKFSEQLHTDYPGIHKRMSKGNPYYIVSNSIEKLPELFKTEVEDGSEDDYIQLLALEKRQRVKRYIDKRYIRPCDNLYRYKAYIPQSNGSGSIWAEQPTRVIGQTGVLAPGECTSQTFFTVGCFETEQEALNVEKYLNTKFVRALVGVLKATPNNPPSRFHYVPLQDFTDRSDIDWGETIQEIDEHLYRKYNLTTDEREFIEQQILAVNK